MKRHRISPHHKVQCTLYILKTIDSKANMRNMQKKSGWTRGRAERVQIDMQWLISSVHFIVMVNLAQPGKGEGRVHGALHLSLYHEQTSRAKLWCTNCMALHKKFLVNNNNFYLDSLPKHIKNLFLPQATALLGHRTLHSPKQRQAF